MIIKMTLIILAVFLITPVFSQESIEQEGVIRMSESDLTQIISKIVAAKKSNILTHKKSNDLNDNELFLTENQNFEATYLNQLLDDLIKRVDEEKMKPDAYSMTNATNVNDLYLKRRVEDLEDKIERFQKLLNDQLKTNPRNIVSEPVPEQKYTLPINEEITNTEADFYKQKLQLQLDSIYKLFETKKMIQNTASAPNYTNDFSSIEKKLLELKNELNKKESTLTDYEILTEKYNLYSQTIHFENNSKTINNIYSASLNEIVSILKTFKNIDVLVQGFASNKGNPIVNQNLSMQRTEAIKTTLIAKGIHPTRILTVYFGIDYEAPTDQMARRVDLSLIVRK